MLDLILLDNVYLDGENGLYDRPKNISDIWLLSRLVSISTLPPLIALINLIDCVIYYASCGEL